jgi:hypothetical protein
MVRKERNGNDRDGGRISDPADVERIALRNAISGSWLTSRRRAPVEPLYRQPRKWLNPQRRIGAMNQLRCS